MLRARTIITLLAAPISFSASATSVAADEPLFAGGVAAAAAAQAEHSVVYDPAYVVIPYPWGDVPTDRGVCTDVVVRAFRAQGVDLQKRVHEDMTADFSAYPDDWGLSRPDPNIDHRRVLNLEVFFARHGAELPVSDDPADYAPGDVVSWNLLGLRGFRPHIGVVTDRIARSGRPMIAHNVGFGTKVEDVLFDWLIRGHYRYEVAPGEEDRPAEPQETPEAAARSPDRGGSR
jgi:uncharacterized protein YijF (DUF1287 family)